MLLGADRTEKSFHYTIAYLEVFTDLLPGNVLVKSVNNIYICGLRYFKNISHVYLWIFSGKIIILS
jgi:hypothetical protein